jgi:hypothetical protein
MENTMSEPAIFRGFFSYAHHDAKTDPGLIVSFTKVLEDRINAKLTNARFKIWRDNTQLRLGGVWSSRIEEELRTADVLIVLLTPRWIESEHCRKEYLIFEGVEAGRDVGEYVAPILIRTVEHQEKHFTPEQANVYARIRSRQFQKAIATDFIKMNDADRIELIDKIADDIEGMIERRRVLTRQKNYFDRAMPSEQLPVAQSQGHPFDRPLKTREFNPRAQNYEQVDFVRDAEIVLDRPTAAGQRDVLAHVGFVERLYVQGKRGRIEFGVRRAFVSMSSNKPSALSKIDQLKRLSDNQSAYYTTLHGAPDAITVCMDPCADSTSLSSLPLPPSENENFLSKIATGPRDLRAEQVSAELIISLNAEGLYLMNGREISPRTEAMIKIIMDLAKTKIAKSNDQKIDASGQFRRQLPVTERQ